MYPQLCKLVVGSLLLSITGCASVSKESSPKAASPVKVTESDSSVRVEFGGKLFTEYHYKNVPRPFLYPIIGPGELPMTRNWPMKDVPGEEHDHPHHRSLWFTHGSVNGFDFWTERANSGKIVHDKFVLFKAGASDATIKTKNKWIAPDGTLVCTDDLSIVMRDNPRTIDFEITIHALDKDVVFGDTKEGSMAFRVAESMRLKAGKDQPPGKGHIVMNTGVRDEKTWGTRAEWCDYHGPVDGKILGVAIFDHPQNPRHPTWWHVRDYGLFAVNPFGIHDFEKKEKGTGDMTIPAGKSVTFRYRFYLHEGDEKQGNVAEEYKRYIKSSKTVSK